MFYVVSPFLLSYSPMKRLVKKRTHSAGDTEQTANNLNNSQYHWKGGPVGLCPVNISLTLHKIDDC